MILTPTTETFQDWDVEPTQESVKEWAVEEFLDTVEGELHDRGWRNFSIITQDQPLVEIEWGDDEK